MSESWKFKSDGIPAKATRAPVPALAGELVRGILLHTGDVAYRYRLFPTLGYEFVSEAVVDMLGYTSDELYADPTLPQRLVYPDDMERMRRVLDSPPGQQFEVFLRWVRRDGRVIATELRCVIVRDASGKPLWLDGVARDVTQRDTDRERSHLIQWRGSTRNGATTARTVRVLIADDHELTRAGLRQMVVQDPGLDLVGEVEDGQELVRLVQMLEPYLVLVDINLPLLDGMRAARRLKAVSPLTRILLLGLSVDARLLLDAVKAGVAGYVLKNANESALRSAIWEVLAGNLAVDEQVARTVLRQLADEMGSRHATSDVLSAREHEVLRLLARGFTNREIAERLTVTPSTIKIHVEHILAKLGVSDRTQAAVRAIELGFVGTEGRTP